MDAWSACRAGDDTALASILAGGGGTYLPSSFTRALVSERDAFGFTPLHLAAAHGSVRCVRLLLEAGAGVHTQDVESGWTAMHHACHAGHAGVALLLLRVGAELSYTPPEAYALRPSTLLHRDTTKWSASPTTSWRGSGSGGGGGAPSRLADHEGLPPLDVLLHRLALPLRAVRVAFMQARSALDDGALHDSMVTPAGRLPVASHCAPAAPRAMHAPNVRSSEDGDNGARAATTVAGAAQGVPASAAANEVPGIASRRSRRPAARQRRARRTSTGSQEGDSDDLDEALAAMPTVASGAGARTQLPQTTRAVPRTRGLANIELSVAADSDGMLQEAGFVRGIFSAAMLSSDSSSSSSDAEDAHSHAMPAVAAADSAAVTSDASTVDSPKEGTAAPLGRASSGLPLSDHITLHVVGDAVLPSTHAATQPSIVQGAHSLPMPDTRAPYVVASASTHVWSWGANELQLGFASTASTHSQPRVLVLPDTSAAPLRVSAAKLHSGICCAVGAPLLFGRRLNGRLGEEAEGGASSTTTSASFVTPTQHPWFMQRSITVSALALGERHSVVLTANGHVYCWGDNKFGACGAPAAETGGAGYITAPRRIEALVRRCRVTRIAAGAFHTAVAASDAALYAWGGNQAGQCANRDHFADLARRRYAATGKAGGAPAGGAAGTSSSADAAATCVVWGVQRMDALAVKAGGSGSASASTALATNFSLLDDSLDEDARAGWQVKQLAAGDLYTLVLTTGGDVFVAGNGSPAWSRLTFDESAARSADAAAAFKDAAAALGAISGVASSTSACGSGSGSVDATMVGERDAWTRATSVSAAATSVRIHSVCGARHHAAAIDVHGNVWTWGDARFPEPQAHAPSARKASAAPVVGVQTPELDTAQAGGIVTTLAWCAPRRVSCLARARVSAVSIAAGLHATAVVDAFGSVWLWGDSTAAKVGLLAPPASTPPSAQAFLPDCATTHHVPRRHPQLQAVLDVSLGDLHALALTATLFPPLPPALPAASDVAACWARLHRGAPTDGCAHPALQPVVQLEVARPAEGEMYAHLLREAAQPPVGVLTSRALGSPHAALTLQPTLHAAVHVSRCGDGASVRVEEGTAPGAAVYASAGFVPSLTSLCERALAMRVAVPTLVRTVRDAEARYAHALLAYCGALVALNLPQLLVSAREQDRLALEEFAEHLVGNAWLTSAQWTARCERNREVAALHRGLEDAVAMYVRQLTLPPSALLAKASRQYLAAAPLAAADADNAQLWAAERAAAAAVARGVPPAWLGDAAHWVARTQLSLFPHALDPPISGAVVDRGATSTAAAVEPLDAAGAGAAGSGMEASDSVSAGVTFSDAHAALLALRAAQARRAHSVRTAGGAAVVAAIAAMCPCTLPSTAPVAVQEAVDRLAANLLELACAPRRLTPTAAAGVVHAPTTQSAHVPFLSVWTAMQAAPPDVELLHHARDTAPGALLTELMMADALLLCRRTRNVRKRVLEIVALGCTLLKSAPPPDAGLASALSGGAPARLGNEEQRAKMSQQLSLVQELWTLAPFIGVVASVAAHELRHSSTTPAPVQDQLSQCARATHDAMHGIEELLSHGCGPASAQHEPPVLAYVDRAVALAQQTTEAHARAVLLREAADHVPGALLLLLPPPVSSGSEQQAAVLAMNAANASPAASTHTRTRGVGGDRASAKPPSGGPTTTVVASSPALPAVAHGAGRKSDAVRSTPKARSAALSGGSSDPTVHPTPASPFLQSAPPLRPWLTPPMMPAPAAKNSPLLSAALPAAASAAGHTSSTSLATAALTARTHATDTTVTPSTVASSGGSGHSIKSIMAQEAELLRQRQQAEAARSGAALAAAVTASLERQAAEKREEAITARIKSALQGGSGPASRAPVPGPAVGAAAPGARAAMNAAGARLTPSAAPFSPPDASSSVRGVRKPAHDATSHVMSMAEIQAEQAALSAHEVKVHGDWASRRVSAALPTATAVPRPLLPAAVRETPVGRFSLRDYEAPRKRTMAELQQEAEDEAFAARLQAEEEEAAAAAAVAAAAAASRGHATDRRSKHPASMGGGGRGGSHRGRGGSSAKRA